MGFCPPCQIKQWAFVQWAFVQWDIVQWAFVLVGFCPSGLLSVPPTIVGILTFISRINTTSESLKARKISVFQHFSFYDQLKFYAQLS